MLNYVISSFKTAPFKSSQVVLFLGFGLLMNHKYRTACSFNSRLSDIQSPSKLYLLHVLFNRSLSFAFSKVVDMPIPQPLRLPVFKTLVYSLGIDTSELVYPLDAYESLAMFFTRNLPECARPIQDYSNNTLTSPVDGRVMVWGEIDRDRVGQITVKGATYNVNCFLGEQISAKSDNTNRYDNYLANSATKKMEKRLHYIVLKIPLGAYHHFHSPTDFYLTERRYFPGESLPLGKFVTKYFSDIFTANERVVFKGINNCGNRLFIIPVGTFCLGKITHNVDLEFDTNRSGQIQVYLGGPIETKRYDTPIVYRKGDEIGEFKQGSAVVLIFESDGSVDWNVKIGDMVKIGEKIVKM